MDQQGNKISEADDEAAKALLEQHPFNAENNVGNNMMQNYYSKRKAAEETAEQKTNKIVVKGMEEQLEGKTKYLEELMDRLNTQKTSMNDAKTRYYKMREENMAKRAQFTKNVVTREQKGMLEIMTSDSVDKLQKDLQGIMEHISKSTKEQINFHTQNSMFQLEMERKYDMLAFESKEGDLKMSHLAKKAEQMLNLKRLALNN